jgi:prephenate dehydratase
MKMIALGPGGTYGHEASEITIPIIQKRLSSNIDLCFGTSNTEVLEAATNQRCLALVPIENSSAGLVAGVVKGFWLRHKKAPIHVIGEVELPIYHNLLVQPWVDDVSEIDEVLTHEQALEQCVATLSAMGIRKKTPVSSTAGAAHQVSLCGLRNVAAIASAFAGRTYGLKTLKDDMADSNGNATRFHILGPTKCAPTGQDRTAMIFWLPHMPRALANATWAISCEGADMSTIHSIPLGTFGKIAMYCELDQHCDTDAGRRIFDRLRTVTDGITVLGSYPQAVQ